jgi:hypothetical protein
MGDRVGCGMNRFRIMSSVRTFIGVIEMPVFGEVLQGLDDCPILCDQQDGSCQSYDVQRRLRELLQFTSLLLPVLQLSACRGSCPGQHVTFCLSNAYK